MILRVEGLDLFYGDAQALDGVSIDAEEGELIAIVGANGAGKSSLIRTIAGIETPRAGRIFYRGSDITGLPSYRICNLGIGQVAEANGGGEPPDGRALAAGARSDGRNHARGVHHLPAP